MQGWLLQSYGLLATAMVGLSVSYGSSGGRQIATTLTAGLQEVSGMNLQEVRGMNE